MSGNIVPPELEFADDSDDMSAAEHKRQRVTRIVAWVAIGALLLTGGVATGLTLLLG